MWRSKFDGSLKVIDKEIDYVDEISSDSPQDRYKPLLMLKEKFNYNSITIDFGIKFQ